MPRLALPDDPDAVIDLVEDVEVDAAELERFGSRGGVIVEHGFALRVIGAIGPRKSYRRGDVARGHARYARTRGR